jgi:hypothetical protein
MILPLVLRNMFYRGADIHHLFVSDQTRVGDITPFRVMQCLPIVAAGSILTSFPIDRNGGGRTITGTAMKRQNSLKVTKY